MQQRRVVFAVSFPAAARRKIIYEPFSCSSILHEEIE
jgi:hypothetical protein